MSHALIIAIFVYSVECILDSNEEVLVKAAAQKVAYDAKNKGKGLKSQSSTLVKSL